MEEAPVLLSKEKAIDLFQYQLSSLEPVLCPLVHVFTKGLYTRQIFMPAFTVNSDGEVVQTVIVSQVHKTQHVFNVSMGSASVYNSADEFLGLIEAPYLNITPPMTRRVLRIESDCIWTTTHPLPYITGEENDWSEDDKVKLIERIVSDLIEPHEINTDEMKELTGGIACHL